MHNPPPFITRLPRRIVCALITLYQRTLSPDHGPLKELHPCGFCRHEPTCSQYAKEQIASRGVLRGLPSALWQIARCNPFVKLSDAKLQKVIAKSSQTAADAVSSVGPEASGKERIAPQEILEKRV